MTEEVNFAKEKDDCMNNDTAKQNSITRIFVTNDDGIGSIGVAELVKALSRVPNTEVYVSVPAVQQSGMSNATTLKGKIRISETSLLGATRAITVASTPADACFLGMKVFQSEGIVPDIVFSGINHGFNTAEDTHYSGTVGAAMDAVLHNIPAVAVSTELFPHESRPYTEADFEAACLAAVKFLPYALNSSPDYLYNINVANIPPENVKGWRVTKVGHIQYDLGFTRESVTELSFDHWYESFARTMGTSETHPGTDTAALIDGYVSLTPILRDWTGYAKMEELRLLVGDWKLGE